MKKILLNSVKNMFFTISEDKKGDISIGISPCSTCGKPLNNTSVDFGMDCENNCGRKAFDKLPEDHPTKKAMKMLKFFFKTMEEKQ